MKLIHVTSALKILKIQEEGLHEGSYFTNLEDLADYYAETIEDEGGIPLKVYVELSALDENAIVPDMPGLEEPIMSVVRDLNDESRSYDENDLWDDWKDTKQTWKDCLDLIGSIKYMKPVPVKDIQFRRDVENDNENQQISVPDNKDNQIKKKTPKP